MKLLILFGPPAVGKTTIGKILEQKTDFKLFHNHMVMDGIMHLFGVGSPAEDRLSRIVRESVIKEAASSDINLIFTYVWDFGKDKGKANIDSYKKIYEEAGGEVYFVELIAPVEVRAERANNPTRTQEKKYAPDKKRTLFLEGELNFKSPDPFFYKNYKKIDTANKTPETVSEEIVSLIGE